MSCTERTNAAVESELHALLNSIPGVNVSEKSHHAIQRLRRDHPHACRTGHARPVEHRRWKWTTDRNLYLWHEGAERSLVDLGFAEYDEHDIAPELGGGFARIRLKPG